MVMSDKYNVCSRVWNVKMNFFFLGAKTGGEIRLAPSSIELFELFCAW